MQIVADVAYALVGDLADVYQAVFARHHTDDGANVVVEDFNHSTFVHFAHFHFGSDFFDAFFRSVAGFLSGCGNSDGAVFRNIDFSTGFGGNRADGFAAFTNDFADFVLVDFPKELILEIEKTDAFIFPDLMMNTYPLISERFREVLLLFDIEVFIKRVLLMDKNSRAIKSYYLLYTDNLLTADFNKSFKAVRDKDEKIKFIVSLDFAI